MSIIIENQQTKVTVDESVTGLIKSVVDHCLAKEQFAYEVEVGITLVDNERIREINREYRHKDKATDVLSFPMLNMKNGELTTEPEEYDMDENRILLGDIVISLEMGRWQAEEYGHSAERELAFLVAHGMLHLLGYDHETEQDESLMLKKQEELLQDLGYIRF